MSAFGGTNPFVALKDMLEGPPPIVATVNSANADGTYNVTTRNGGTQRVTSSWTVGAGDKVLVQEGHIQNEVPALTSSTISVG